MSHAFDVTLRLGRHYPLSEIDLFGLILQILFPVYFIRFVQTTIWLSELKAFHQYRIRWNYPYFLLEVVNHHHRITRI